MGNWAETLEVQQDVLAQFFIKRRERKCWMNLDIGNAIMNPNDVLNQLMNQRKKYLSMIPEIKQGTGKDKRYSVYIRDPRTNERKLIRKPTREEVESAALEYLMSLDGICDESSKITVGSYWKDWYDFKIAHNVELTSMSKTKFVSDYKTFIKDSEFASMPIQKVKPKHIEDFLCEQIKENDLSIKRACQLAGYIKGIFKLAYRNDLIKKDIWPRVDLRNVVYPCCRRRTKVRDEEYHPLNISPKNALNSTKNGGQKHIVHLYQNCISLPPGYPFSFWRP